MQDKNEVQGGTLYVVATPIGNLADMTFRAIDILKGVDLVLCEDTRTTKTLLRHYEIETPTKSYHAHSSDKNTEEIVALLDQGSSIALVSDAGTPGVSDPGSHLVRTLRQRNPDISIVAVPGASAVSAAISVAGLHSNEYVFVGFFPKKKGRETLLNEIADSDRAYVFFESTHRIVSVLELFAGHPILSQATVTVAKEITKLFEHVFQGTAEQILARIAEDSKLSKGEFVVLVETTR